MGGTGGTGKNQIGSIVKSIKEKVMGSLKKKVKSKKNKESSSSSLYAKMDKTASVKVEIRSRQARQQIEKTIRAADHPGKAFVS